MATKNVSRDDHQVKKPEPIPEPKKNDAEQNAEQPVSAVPTGIISLIELAEGYLSTRYHFRRNQVLDKTEFKLKPEQSFKIMRETDFNSLYRELHKTGIPISRSDLRCLLNSNFVRPYDPFCEYFAGLPKWDGETNHILELANTVKTTNDELFRECLKKWLVALVASAIRENEVNHTVLVFAGKQGIGKTTWQMNLAPQVLKDYRFSGIIDPGSKDSIINLSECLLIILDELESLNTSKLGALKETITKSAIRVRRPYGWFSEKFIRRASFAGSVNKSQFLSDTTGNRRFLCFEVTGIDYQKSINMDKVYAQAMHLLDTGYQYWFDEKTIGIIAANNEGYQEVRLEEELLLKYFEPEKSKEKGELLTATEIAKIITSNMRQSVTGGFVINLGKVLHKHGFTRIKDKRAYKYIVKKATS